MASEERTYPAGTGWVVGYLLGVLFGALLWVVFGDTVMAVVLVTVIGVALGVIAEDTVATQPLPEDRWQLARLTAAAIVLLGVLFIVALLVQ